MPLRTISDHEVRPESGGPNEDAAAAAAEFGPTSTPIRMLQIVVVTVFVFPSTAVVSAVGAAGYVGGLAAIATFALWGAWLLFGEHDFVRTRSPVRLTVGGLWICSLASYAAFQFRDRDVLEINGADRWIMVLLGISGVALVAAECLHTVEHIHRVLRPLSWAAGFSGAVGAAQFWFGRDFAPTLASLLPGFVVEGLGDIQQRGGLARVAGTAIHPIEFGTTAAMVLPVVTYLAMYDRTRSLWLRIPPVVLVGLSIPLSVSRSSTLAIAVAMLPFVLTLPARQRLVGLACAPVAVIGVFLVARGLISTLTDYFLEAGQDTSISTRTDDYPIVRTLVGDRPIFGMGGGTYLPDNTFLILDNAYLKWAVEFGLFGLVVLVVLVFVKPIIAAFRLRTHAPTVQVQILCSAVGCGVLAAAVSSITFDAFSYPAFTLSLALLIGLTGACWRIVHVRPSADSARS